MRLERARRRVLRCVLSAVLLGVLPARGASAATPPDVERRPVEQTMHADTRVDPYAWLRNKDDPAVIEYLKRENAYTERVMAPTEPLQERLYEEMLGRIKQTDLSVPYRDGKFFYYSRTEEGKAYPIYARKRGSLEADEQIILDVNELGEGEEYVRVTNWEVSPDGRLLAYLVDETGYERPTLYVKDLASGEMIGDPVEDLGPWSLAWANDNRTLFYTRQDETNRPNRLCRRTIGEGAGREELLHTEDDAKFYLGVGRSRSGDYLFMSLGSQITSEVWFLSADEPRGAFEVIEPRRRGIEYDVEHRGDRFYIRTNEDAINFRVVSAPVSSPGAARWEDVIPHEREVAIQSIDVFADHMAVSERRGGYRSLRIHDFETGRAHLVETPEEVSVLAPATNKRFDTRTLRMTYSSPITPRSVYDYDMAARERELLKRDEVLGGYDPSRYAVSRMWAEARDGARIPVSILHLKDVEPDGTNPCLLYGYGSYGASIDPWFSSNRFSVVDRGVVFAIAHIRGGGAMGRPWYEQGKFMSKKNTFRDFIDAGEALVDAGYAHPDRLAIQGGSAGGLLIGAVINMRPDLFAAAHAAVPFVDCLNTMLDASIPLTVIEYDEWGNPNDPRFYAYIKSYAPYENVSAQDYPHLLVTAGLNDPRVHYWEPAKWVARLRDLKTDDNLLLLRINMGAGHGGSSGRYERLEETAFEYAFLLERLGATELTID